MDTLIVIDNNNLHKILGSNITMRKAFEEADKVLCDAARGIAEIITTEGYINVDFADVCTIMREGGRALMGTAVAEGEGRATQAVQEAINSPLLENNGVVGSRAIIVNITASEDSLRMDETTAIVEQVQESAGMDANIIYGIVYDESMADSLRVTVIATRFEEKVVEQHVPAQAQQVVKEPLRASLEENFPQRDSQKRLDRREREERIKRLNSKVYDLHDPESLNGLESTPAYLRKRVTLDMDANESPKYSRTSVDEDFDNSYRLRENNSFLHDNVD
ncbi:MAG: cell division protein FtsZ [Bacteroidota bacterium]